MPHKYTVTELPEDLRLSRIIQTKLGHASLKTTMIYTHCVPVRTIKEAKSPLDFD